jgi:alcohol dehydrogenase (cytochrome c)
MRRLTWGRFIQVAATAALMVAASGVMASAKAVKPSSGQDIGWTMIGNNLKGWRYSSATQITPANVGQLKVAWTFDAGKIPGGVEDTPLVIGNVAYVTTAFNHVFALNATTGKVIWSYNPDDGVQVACCGPDARGLAYHDGTLYMLTLDDRLIALNAATGKPLWHVKIGSAKQGLAETAAPLFYNGDIYVGSSGAELGIRGFEEARSATTGKLLWIFYTVPPRDQSWVKLNHGIAGGTVWNNPVIDRATNTLYIDTANPAPLLYANNRPGPDHWTDSVVALNATTGKFEWAQQTVPHDIWDYDNSANPILVPTGDGMGVGVPGKSGMYWEFSATQGYLLTTPVCFVTCSHALAPPLKGSVTVSPAALGGDNWSQPAYDPQTDDVYVAGVDSQAKISSSPKGDVYENGKDQTYLGSTISILPGSYGTITAINVNTGTIQWQVKTPATSEGGPVVTAGGLAIGNSTNNGYVYLMNAETGKVVRTLREPGPVGGGDITYEVNGKQYLLVPLGGAGTQQGTGRLQGVSVSEFVAYALNG